MAGKEYTTAKTFVRMHGALGFIRRLNFTRAVKITVLIISVGTVMFASGLVMFYSIEMGQIEPTLRLVKNAGIFVGLTGMGAVMAGILLLLMAKSGPVQN